ASATQYVITVGGNTTTNSSLVFQPQEVHAALGDSVVFNFTLGNHSATQSTFAAPCVLAFETNSSINGFNSEFRDAGNGTAITILNVTIDETNVNTPLWFFDYNTCAKGGVGVINANDSSTQTLLGFERNAIRLNGTNSSSTSSAYPSSTAPSSTSASSSSSTATSSSAADRNVVIGGLSAIPLAFAAL
ncbi:hypothetical protein BKA93DRAFT_712043, partial [Sparassis latifolia]